MKRIKAAPYPHEIQAMLKKMPPVGTVLSMNGVNYMTISSDKKKGELTLKLVIIAPKEDAKQASDKTSGTPRLWKWIKKIKRGRGHEQRRTEGTV